MALSAEQIERINAALTATAKAFIRAVGDTVEARGGASAPWTAVHDCLLADDRAPDGCEKTPAFLETLEKDGWVQLVGNASSLGWDLTSHGWAIYPHLDDTPAPVPVVLRPHPRARLSLLADRLQLA